MAIRHLNLVKNWRRRMARRTQQSVLDRTRQSLNDRAAELRPLIQELQQIEAALEALPRNGAVGRTRTQDQRQRSTTPAKRRTRRGQRAQRFLRIVKANPGITVSGVAKKMGVQPSGLYGVANALAKERKLKKNGTKLSIA